MKTYCIRWQGSKDKDGYGLVPSSLRNNITKQQRMHRFVWEVYNNKKIPEGKLVLHKCDNPWCINAEHLYVGTQKDNAQDASIRNRCAGQKKTHCPKGHPYNKANTYIHAKSRKAGRRKTRLCRTCLNERYRNWYHKRKK